MYLNVSECLRLSSPLGIGHKAKKAGPHFDRIEAAPATCHGKSTSELSLAGPKYEAMSAFQHVKPVVSANWKPAVLGRVLLESTSDMWIQDITIVSAIVCRFCQRKTARAQLLVMI